MGLYRDSAEVAGGLVALLVFKTSVGPKRSQVGSIPIHLRHKWIL